MVRIRSKAIYGGCLLAAVALSGCGSSEPSLADFNHDNIRKLRGAYGMFLVKHDLKGPESEEELKDFLTTDAGAIRKMELMGVPKDGIDDIFVSERDGKPFKVRYGLNGLGDYPIVFEAEGVDGKRMVAYGPPRELGPDEYEAAWNGELQPGTGMDVLGEAPPTK